MLIIVSKSTQIDDWVKNAEVLIIIRWLNLSVHQFIYG
jgi:hypothetical protein